MKIYKGHQFRPAVEHLILKVASAFTCEVNITWANVPTAGINRHGDIYIANVKDDAVMTHRDLIRWAGYGVHEILHNLYTDFDASGDSKYEDALHNAIEDAWIEHKGIASGLTGNINGLLSELIDGMVEDALLHVTDWADPRQYPFVLAVYLRNHASIKCPLADGLAPIFDEAKRRLNGLNNSATSHDTLAIAQWVMRQLQNLEDQPDQQQGQQQSDGQAGDETGNQASDADGDAGNQPSQQPGKARPVVNDNDAVNPEPKLKPGDKSSYGYYRTEYLGREYEPLRGKWADLSIAVPAKLRYEVRRLFDNSGTDEFLCNRRSGSINVSALPSHSYNDKLFKLRKMEDGIDTACTILVDASGSMVSDGGTINGQPARMLAAIKTCAALMDTLRRAQVATSVIVFGDCPYVLKGFNTSVPKALETLACLADLGGTNDYMAVRYAHSMLHSRPESRKICFVITDGEGDMESTREQCESGVRLGITTIGVGIDLNVSNVYPQSVTVTDLADLGQVSFSKIKLAA